MRIFIDTDSQEKSSLSYVKMLDNDTDVKKAFDLFYDLMSGYKKEVEFLKEFEGRKKVPFNK